MERPATTRSPPPAPRRPTRRRNRMDSQDGSSWRGHVAPGMYRACDPMVIACRDCDALQRVARGSVGARPRCFRCGAELLTADPGQARGALPLALAAIPLFLAAQLLPLIGLEGGGDRVAVTAWGAVKAMQEQQMPALAVLVLVTTILFPAVALVCAAFLLLWLRRGRIPAAASFVERAHAAVQPWSQVEILLFGVLVAFGKLSTVFQVVPGAGLLCLVGALALEKWVGTAVGGGRFWAVAQRAGLVAITNLRDQRRLTWRH